MAKIQMELSDEESTILEVYKLKNKIKNKQEAIKKMINSYEYDVSIKPKRVLSKQK